MNSYINEKSYRRKSIIKTVAIIFLAVLLVLTFFSNTIMNFSLPEVSAQYASGGSITTRIRGSGTVEANSNYEVRIGQKRKIREVLVKQGDAVTIGDVLFKLEDIESEEVKTARQAVKDAEKAVRDAENAVKDAKTAYDESLRGVNPSTSTAVLALEQAKENLSEAQKKLNNAQAGSGNVSAAKAAYKAAEDYYNELVKKKTKLDALKTAAATEAIEEKDITKLNIEGVIDIAGSSYTDAKSVFDTSYEAYKKALTEQENTAGAALRAEQDLKDAQDAKTQYDNSHSNSNVTDAQILAAQRELESLNLQMQRLNEDYTKLIADNVLQRQSAELAFQKAVEAFIKSADGYKEQIEYNDAYIIYLDTKGKFSLANTEKSNEIQEIKKKLELESDSLTEADKSILYASIKKLEDDIQSNEISIQNAYLACEQIKAKYNLQDSNIDARIAFDTAYNAYINSLSSIYESELTKRRAIEDLQISIKQKQEDYDSMSSAFGDARGLALRDAVKAAETAKNHADKAKTDADRELEKAEKAHLEAGVDLLDILLDVLEDMTDKAKDSYDTKKQQYDELNTDQNIDTLRANYNNAKSAVLDAQNKLYQENQGVSKAERELENKKTALEDANKELEAKNKELEKAVSNSTDTVITAPIAGNISQINVTAGAQTGEADTLCTIFVAEKGYKVTFNVTKEQANRINVGDPAKAQYFWGGECNATVGAIKPDLTNAQNRIIELNVEGDVTIGQSITFTLGDRSAEYDTVVPNSAIREDSNGKFVLVVESKSTPLGTRYKAARIDVQVVVSDETKSALSTSFFGNEFIITTSTKPIKAGDQVRLVNN